MRLPTLKPLVSAVTVLLLIAITTKAHTLVENKSVAVSAKIPIAFEPDHNQVNPSIVFFARAGNLELKLRPMGFDLSLAGRDQQSTALKIDFVGANSNASISASDRMIGETNYFMGRDPSSWKTHIPNFGRVIYSSIYPGVDVVFHGNGQRLEHDFVIAPGADYHAIRMRFSGSDKVSLQSDGTLVIPEAAGSLFFYPPRIYQTKGHKQESRRGGFILLANGDVGFRVDQYDRSEQLVIDPILNYSTFVSNSPFLTFGVAVDSVGNTFLAGCAPDLNGQTARLAVIKMNAAGNSAIYTSYFGDSCEPYGGVKVDTNGNAVVAAASYQSANLPLKNPILTPANGALWYAYICSLSPDGSALNYASVLGGSGWTYVDAVALDSNGNAYVTGDTDWNGFPQTQGALKNATPAYPNNVVYVAKFLINGSLGYSALLGVDTPQNGGGGPIGPTGITVDNAGNAYVTGSAGTLWPTTANAYEPQIPGQSPYAAPFVTSISADGSSVNYSTFIGSYGRPGGIAVNQQGDVVLAGSNVSPSFPTTSNAYQSTYPAAPEPINAGSFFSILNSNGSQLVYSSFLHGTGAPVSSATQILGMTLDSSDDIWLTGTTTDEQFPLVHPLSSTVGSTSALPGFLSEFDPNGTELMFSTYVGDVIAGAQSETIAIDQDGNAHLAGVSDYNLYTTLGAFITSENAPPTGSDYLYGFAELIYPAVAAPAICVSYPSNGGLYFGGTHPTTEALSITNCGTLPLTITNVQSSNPQFTIPAASNGCVKTLSVNGTCNLTVNFTGSSTYGTIKGILTVTSNTSVPEFVLLQAQVSPPPDFVFSTNPSVLPTVVISAPGASSAPIVLTIADQAGYSGTVNFTPASCSIAPAGSMSTCSFAPGSVVGSGSTQVIVNTTGSSSSMAQTNFFNFAPWEFWAFTLTIVLWFCLRTCNQSRMNITLSMVLLVALFACNGCGGGGSQGNAATGAGNVNTSGATPTGTVYTVTVTAMGLVSHTASFQFTVQ